MRIRAHLASADTVDAFNRAWSATYADLQDVIATETRTLHQHIVAQRGADLVPEDTDTLPMEHWWDLYLAQASSVGGWLHIRYPMREGSDPITRPRS